MPDVKKNNRVRTFYATENNEVTIICSDCGYTKIAILSPSNISETENKADCKFKCKCGAVFSCRIEYRKTHRRKVRLAGTYRNLRNQETVEILVKNVSWDGIGFTCMSHHELKMGDELEVNFQLKDPRRSQVNRTATVRKINGREIGASFGKTTTVKDDLGFYLLNLNGVIGWIERNETKRTRGKQ